MRSIFLRAVSMFTSTAYRIIQGTVPEATLIWMANRVPYKADVYGPRGFFLPMTKLPPDVPAPDGDPLAGVPGGVSLSLLILRTYTRINGKVIFVEQRPKDAEWQHETFYLRPDDLGILNQYALIADERGSFDPMKNSPARRGEPILECEPEVGGKMPEVGQRVAVEGPYIIDLANGWTEVHPCRKWEVIK